MRDSLASPARMEVVPRGRVELPTPAFSGPRSTGELPRHRHNQRFYGISAAQESKNVGQNLAADFIAMKQILRLALLASGRRFSSDRHFIDSSNSFIQSRFFRTSRGFAPSGGPTMPSFSIKSIK